MVQAAQAVSRKTDIRGPAQVRMSLQKYREHASLKLPPADPNLAMRWSMSTDTSGDLKWNWMRPSTSSLRASSISSCASSILQAIRHFSWRYGIGQIMRQCQALSTSRSTAYGSEDAARASTCMAEHPSN